MSLRGNPREQEPQEVAPHIDCAYGGCPKSASIRVRQGSATANVCRDHYERFHVAMAKKFLVENGMKTKDNRKALLRKFANAAPPQVRRMIEKEAA